MMKFPFWQIQFQRPSYSLHGRTTRPKPILTVSLVGPVSTVVEDARIDSGSDDTLFPEDLAVKVGVDLSHAPIEVHQSQSSGRLIVRFAEIKLRLTDGIEFREWPAKVGFVAGLRKSVLGFGSFLQFFTTTLRGDDEIVELEVNRLYPGI